MATENLFTSQTPLSTNVGPDGPITLAVTMYFAVAGTISKVRFFAPDNVGGTYTAVVWEITGDDGGTPAGTLLTTEVFGTMVPQVWNEITLSSPVAVVNAKTYRIGVRSSVGRYTATTLFFTSAALTNGNITSPQTGVLVSGRGTPKNGTFVTDVTSYPTSTFNAANYFVDVGFDAAGSGTTTVTSDLDLRWNVRTVVTSALDLRWSVRAVVTSALDIRWGVGGRVTSDLSLLWKVISDAVTPVLTGGRGWWTLLDIQRTNIDNAREDEVPLACPNDGEPLELDTEGRWRCHYDGWIYRS